MSPTPELPTPRFAVTAMAPAAWGLTYLATTELLPPGRPLLAGAARALCAGCLLFAVAPRLPRGEWWFRALVLGLLNVGAFFAFLFVAAYRLPGGVAAMLGSVQPLLVAALAVVLLSERISARTIIAATLGIAGVSLLVLRTDARLDMIGILAGLGAAVSAATGTVLAKRWRPAVPLSTFTAWQLLVGGLALAPIAYLAEGLPETLTLRNLAGYAWLATGAGAIAYLLWFRCVVALPVTQVALLPLLSPVVASAAGWVVLDQRLTALQSVGALLIVVAVVAGRRRSTAGVADADQAVREPRGQDLVDQRAEARREPQLDLGVGVGGEQVVNPLDAVRVHRLGRDVLPVGLLPRLELGDVERVPVQMCAADPRQPADLGSADPRRLGAEQLREHRLLLVVACPHARPRAAAREPVER